MFIWILAIIVFIYLDQITKYLAVIYLKGQDSFPIIKDVLHLTYVENRGAAFGMFKDHRWVFMIVSTVGIVLLTVYMIKHLKEGRLQNLALSMIIAGGIGNMIDRIVLSYVVDFVDFTLINFAVFNVADTFVCVGCALEVIYLLSSLKNTLKEEKKVTCDDIKDDINSNECKTKETKENKEKEEATKTNNTESKAEAMTATEDSHES